MLSLLLPLLLVFLMQVFRLRQFSQAFGALSISRGRFVTFEFLDRRGIRT